jgi:hypothetical protein
MKFDLSTFKLAPIDWTKYPTLGAALAVLDQDKVKKDVTLLIIDQAKVFLKAKAPWMKLE